MHREIYSFIMKKFFLLFVAFGLMVGCNANDPTSPVGTSKGEKEEITLSVSPSSLTFTGFAMSSKYIYVKCNTDWEIKVENSSMFQSINPRYYGSGNQTIYVTVPEISSSNQSTFTTQRGSITISCKNEHNKTLSKTVECTRKK